MVQRLVEGGDPVGVHQRRITIILDERIEFPWLEAFVRYFVDDAIDFDFTSSAVFGSVSWRPRYVSMPPR